MRIGESCRESDQRWRCEAETDAFHAGARTHQNQNQEHDEQSCHTQRLAACLNGRYSVAITRWPVSRR